MTGWGWWGSFMLLINVVGRQFFQFFKGKVSLEGYWEVLVMERYVNINFKINKMDGVSKIFFVCSLKCIFFMRR